MVDTWDGVPCGREGGPGSGPPEDPRGCYQRGPAAGGARESGAAQRPGAGHLCGLDGRSRKELGTSWAGASWEQGWAEGSAVGTLLFPGRRYFFLIGRLWETFNKQMKLTLKVRCHQQLQLRLPSERAA